MIITATASITFEYDTDDGLVTTVGEAIEDIRSVIDSGDVPAGQYEVTAQTKERPERPDEED